jgi:hypothetical protein
MMVLESSMRDFMQSRSLWLASGMEVLNLKAKPMTGLKERDQFPSEIDAPDIQ